MRKILTEAFSVNLIIVVMLFILGSYAVDQNKGVNTFGTGPSAIYKAETEEKNISLMINIYQGEEYVLKYLELFEQEDITATFFVGGCWAAKNAEVVKKIAEAGQEIGNHGYNHKMHTKLTQEQSRSEILRTNSLIKSITGEETVLFAPPSGDVNAQVVADASSCGCQTIMWTADTIDWRDQDVSKIYARVERNLKPGVFVLMHPTQATLEALPEIILLAKSQGYTFMTVGEQLK